MGKRPPGQARRIGATVGLPVLAALLILASYLWWSPRLPDSLATHFGTGMRADDFTATENFPFIMPPITGGLGVLLGLPAVPMRGNPLGQRMLSATAGGVGLMLLTTNVLLLHAHLNVSDPTGMVLPGWHLAGAVGGLLVGGGLGWLLAGKAPAAEVAPPADMHESVRPVSEHESVEWHRSQTSPPMLGLMFIQFQMALLTCLVGSWWLLTFWIPVFVLLAAFARVTVVVDESGLTLRLLAGWPRVRVLATEIRTAYSRDIDPMGYFGGWGWRSTSKAVSFVLRSGPGLWIHRKQQRPIAVTVPDAAEAAALLNGLRDRHDPDASATDAA